MYFTTKHEKIVYNNRLSNDLPFQVFLAGITYPWEEYRIPHNTGDFIDWDKYILEYILEGKGYIETADRRYEVRAGDYYLLNRNRYHIYGADREEPYRKMFVVFHGPLVDSLMEHHRLKEDAILRHIDMEAPFRQLLGLLERAVPENHADDMDEAMLMIHRMLLPLRPPAIVREMDTAIGMAEKLRRYIDANILIRPLPLEHLSDYFRMSESQMIRVFRKEYGQTPGQYILQKRLEAAEYLLWCSSMPVGEIAAKLYFSDSCYFSAVFRKWRGMSPSQFRKSRR